MIINKHTLGNGLRVVHLQDSATPMVAINLLYDVGSRDEQAGHTGFAHLFEHLMFGGSENVRDFDTPLQKAGGECNAWTNADVTNYYSTLPAHHIETALWLESDRMSFLNLSVKTLEVQRSVVMEEYKQRCLNLPYGDVAHFTLPLSYKVHPYRWPVIGQRIDDIESATLEDVRKFYASFYNPSRAILAVTGNVEWEALLQLVEKWFGPLPSASAYQRRLPQEPRQDAQRRGEVNRPVPQDALFMSFHVPGCMHPDIYACDMLSDILSNGGSSRLKQRLIHERKLFSSIDAPLSGTRDAGLLEIKGKLHPGVSLSEAEEAVWEELRQLQSVLVDAYELQKVKNKYESVHTFGKINYQRMAYRLAWFELNGRADLANDEISKYLSVDAASLMRVAQETFRPDNASILYYRKE